MSTYSPTVFVMIDGLRPDAIGQIDCPNLQSLIERGASTMQAISVMPSITLPCHTSIFHSVPPTRHGITVNVWTPMARPLPGLVDVAKDAGKRCSFIYNWEPLRDVSRPEKLYASIFRDTSYNLPTGDDWVGAEAAKHLQEEQPDFAFVYIGTVDTMGHKAGWMSDEYLRQAERADRNLGTVLAALPESAHILVQADHGGHDRGHGTEMAEDMTIPWIIAGPQIKHGYTITGPVSLIDTAPTLAHLMGIPAHRDWEGRIIQEALVG